ncbi:hypothetical protein CA235_09525 [Sphingomonas sp. ABOLF]|uniref:hypothetical protein n=1 Tax=Sphingomonas sp. ABOLF TaxID=1985879 RepID=UPI000F7DE2F3|nr:hypothetical protein [Sphingomonas sp. ABOLF]RSV15167.1 hypothetical protein CA235_09525 [Sphingomonas sp. ABOLF]
MTLEEILLDAFARRTAAALRRELKQTASGLQAAMVDPSVAAAVVLTVGEQFVFDAIGTAIILMAKRHPEKEAVLASIDKIAEGLRLRADEMVSGITVAQVRAGL